MYLNPEEQSDPIVVPKVQAATAATTRLNTATTLDNNNNNNRIFGIQFEVENQSAISRRCRCRLDAVSVGVCDKRDSESYSFFFGPIDWPILSSYFALYALRPERV